MPLDEKSQQRGRERIARVFRYLKALNEHRNPAKRDLSEQPWTLWFRQLPDHPAIWAFLRRGPDTELLVAANFSADVTGALLPLGPEWADAAVVLTNLPDQDPLQPPPGLKLRPWESVIWRRTK